jgi:hypothetical protein
MLDIKLKKESKKQENQSVAANEKAKRARKSEETSFEKIKKLAKQYENAPNCQLL